MRFHQHWVNLCRKAVVFVKKSFITRNCIFYECWKKSLKILQKFFLVCSKDFKGGPLNPLRLFSRKIFWFFLHSWKMHFIPIQDCLNMHVIKKSFDLQRSLNCSVTAKFFLNQGPSKHQEVSSTPVTKVKKMIVVFWDLLGAIKR